MRYQEIITEIISTPMSATISYDVKTNRLDFDDGDGRPRLMLRNLHKMKLLRRKYLKKNCEVLRLRQLMYGGSLEAKHSEIEAAQNELENIQKEIETLERQRDAKDDVMSMAMKHIRRNN